MHRCFMAGSSLEDIPNFPKSESKLYIYLNLLTLYSYLKSHGTHKTGVSVILWLK